MELSMQLPAHCRVFRRDRNHTNRFREQRGAGLQNSPATGLALDIIFKGKAYPIDAFNVNEKFSCALCGIGFDADVAHEFAKQKIRGLQTYLRISTMKFFNSKPYPFEIHAGGRVLKTEAYFISVANSNQFGK